MLATPPLSLYVHLPWCVSKCPYCDFNSYGLREALPEARYTEALASDMESQASWFAQRRIRSVFFGGGTPSLFSPESIGAVLEAARRWFLLDADAEITLEANPGTIERGRFAGYRDAGVNRVSLGAQTFDARQLRVLGRIHGPGDTRHAVEELHAAGLANFNLDLMYGLPGQEAGEAVLDIEQALALEPAHISHYQLTLEPGTAFAAHPPALPPEELIDSMLEQCQSRLASAGFERYEVSAYARRGRRCQHNVNYWKFGDYVGVGAGAHGKRTDAPGGRIWRTSRVREPRRYLAGARASPSCSAVAATDLPFEFMLNSLRLLEGFEAGDFASYTGLDRAIVLPRIEQLQQRGLLTCTRGRWHASPRGLLFLNDVLTAFLPQEPERTPQACLSTGGGAVPAVYAQASLGHTVNESITDETGQVAV